MGHKETMYYLGHSMNNVNSVLRSYMLVRHCISHYL